ncbi:scabin-related ADP-ribosyltransferase [Streptomyces niveus]|uniref:scabin-related ADP-ribosyltransferase n=1 Tax=Streptomyces niveus TaxID=193462 RepID=UPI0036904AB2
MLKAALRVLATATLATAALAPTAASASPTAPIPAPAPAPAAAAAPALDTAPCGPVGAYRAWDWWRTTTNPLIADTVRETAVSERWQWRHDTNTLWRGDTRENVTDLFEQGFAPRGDAMIPLAEYIVKGGGQNSAHVSTTCEKWVAQKFATYGAAKTGWVYEIDAPGGIDVNATAALNRYESPFLWNKEIDFPGGIEGRYIKQACKFHLTKTDPQTKVNTYENLGCKTNERFRPERPAGLEMPAQR